MLIKIKSATEVHLTTFSEMLQWLLPCCAKNCPVAPTEAVNGKILQAPLLDRVDWFLTEAEMATAREGISRPDLALYSTGNRVTLYAASAPYFTEAAKAFRSVGQHDRLYLTGWSVDNVPFTPLEDAKSGSHHSRFEELVAGAVARGADVRMLVWTNVLEKKQNVAMRDFVNALSPVVPHAGSARFVFDDRLPHATSSHHQKSLIVRRGSELVAYLGGVDLTNDRWDTSAHDQAALRESAGIKKEFNGWLDAHCKLEGPAALDVAGNFIARWNGRPNPRTNDDLMDVVLRFTNPNLGTLPEIDKPYPGEEGPALQINKSPGGHAVQLLRTFSPEKGDQLYPDFAPRGEQSIFHARIKAIRNARNYIFVEDQYFILVPELLEELLKVLPRLQRLIVIVNRTTQPALTGYAKYKFEMVEPLLRTFPNKFRLYTTRKERDLYIHTKVVVIDDVYVTVGSANWNRRSMTSDSEIACSVVDTEPFASPDGITVNKLAYDFRVDKFAEASALPREKLASMPLLAACDALDAAARDSSSSAKSIIEPYDIAEEKARLLLVPDAVREVVDPDADPDVAAQL